LYFKQKEITEVYQFLKNSSVYPLVYSFIEGREHVSWLRGRENEGMLHYLNNRKGDKRLRETPDYSMLFQGDIFYFTCIGVKENLLPVYERFVNDPKYTCLLQQELYRDEYWCEIMPRNATKGNAVKWLKDYLQCDKVISFGDALNDIPMFSISDECYAVSNAAIGLKRKATDIIKSNDENGVAHWLNENFNR